HFFRASREQVADPMIEALISNRAEPNDLILFYFSGHGKLDRQGRLYLAVTNTHAQTLGSTAIPIAQLKDFIDNGRSTRLVIILDCCFSGAAGEAFATSKGDIDSMLQLFSGGRGKYILTASTASQTAQEKESETYSVFTKHLIAGLRTGAADLDGNGLVTVEELYRYIHTQVREENHQEPMQWGLDRRGDLILTFCPSNSNGPGSSAALLPPIRYDYDAVTQMFREGTVIPFLGPGVWAQQDGSRPPLNGELAQRLTTSQEMPDEPVSLVAQKIDMVSGRGVVYDRIRSLYQPEDTLYTPTPAHRFLARIEQPLLILTTAYDTLLEAAFEAEGKPYVVVTHVIRSDDQPQDRGKVVVQYSDRKDEVAKFLAGDLVIDLAAWSVIYKMHGTFGLEDPDSGEEIDSLVVSEEDYVALVSILENPRTTFPSHLARQFRKRMFLFLGYSLHDWGLRAIVDTVQRRGNFRRIQPYSVRQAAPDFERLYWESRRVRLIDAEVSDFIRDLSQALGVPL
ncbi:caspase, EACC1-associated type, partial [Candidatus Entotheonella palauensis]|uniref:caspase, EACC1-associated type n=1 Tax=Candidatus Entotheonella palauensis TaxID=93172 RepID=UPI0015C42413